MDELEALRSQVKAFQEQLTLITSRQQQTYETCKALESERNALMTAIRIVQESGFKYIADLFRQSQ